MSNDNTESISAKLRRWADESESDNRQHFYPTFNACDDLGIKVPDDDFVSERELFRRIADEIDREKREIAERYACQSWMNPADAIAKLATGEIEWAELQQAIDRYYLPRPLFEDGEPVPDGCVVVFCDHDVTNLSPDNLLCVPRRYLGQMNNVDGWCDMATAKAALELAMLRCAIADRTEGAPLRCKRCGASFMPHGMTARYGTRKLCPDCLGSFLAEHGRRR